MCCTVQIATMKLLSMLFLLPLSLTIQRIRTEDNVEQQFNAASSRLSEKLAKALPKGRQEVKVYFEEVMSVAEVDTNLTIESIEGMRKYALVKLEELQNTCIDISKEALSNLTASSYATLEVGLQDQVVRIWILNEEAHDNLTRFEGVVEEFRQNFEECAIDACKVDILEAVLAKEVTIEDDIKITVHESGNLFGALLWRFEEKVLMPLMHEYSAKSISIVEEAKYCPENKFKNLYI